MNHFMIITILLTFINQIICLGAYQQQIPHCKIYTTGKTCIQCEDGYDLSFSHSTCHPKNTQSNLLRTQYQRLLQSCTVPNCVNCNITQSTQCLQCSLGFTLTNGACQCPTGKSMVNNHCINCNISNCSHCSTANICSNCSNSYILNTQGNFCYQCNITNCQDCSSSQICSTCTLGLTPNSNGSQCLNCTLSNCQICIGSSSSQCATCNPGYVHNSNLTSCIQCTIQGCYNCSTNNFCESCQRGYQLNIANGSCFVCTDPCKTCHNNGSCQTCLSRYSEIPSSTSGNCYTCSVANCLRCQQSSPEVCSSCNTGYNLDSQNSSLCVRICTDPNCIACHNNGTCTQCTTFFVLNSSSSSLTCVNCADAPKCKTCSSPSPLNFTECNQGYYLSSNGQCLPCDATCAVCSPSNGTCTQLKIKQGAALTSTGTVALCDQGCDSCSNVDSQTCLQCSDGIVLSSNGKCLVCGYPCKTCLSTNISSCITCLPGTHLIGTSCLTCNPQCNTCSPTDINACETCPYGKAVINGRCNVNCSSNCLSCTSSTQCTECSQGYTVSNGSCIPCLLDCKRCSSENPSICLECGPSLVQKDGSCINCPAHCLSCFTTTTEVICDICQAEYFLTSSFTCQAKCNPPCSTCDTQNLNSCRSCVQGYTYDSTSFPCTPKTICQGGWQFCPRGYTLHNGFCKQCTSNCARCQVNATSTCTSCFRIAWLNSTDNTCNPCPSGCKTCTSDTSCKTCIQGYTLIETPVQSTLTQNLCKPCQSPCGSCSGQTTKCSSCVSGYHPQGWKCISDYNYVFTFVLNINYTTFWGHYTVLIEYISNSTGVSIDSISFTNITNGSTHLQGILTQNQNNPQETLAAYNGLTESLSSGATIAGIQVLSSNIVVNGGSPPSNTSTTNPPVGTPQPSSIISNNLALILGISLPITAILIIGIIIGICIYKRRQKIELSSPNSPQFNNVQQNTAMPVLELTPQAFKIKPDNMMTDFSNQKQIDPTTTLQNRAVTPSMRVDQVLQRQKSRKSERQIEQQQESEKQKQKQRQEQIADLPDNQLEMYGSDEEEQQQQE